MGKRLKKLKKIRLHHEGTHTLVGTFCSLLAFNGLLYLFLSSCLILKVSICLSVIIYAVLLNFFQCPIRLYAGNTDDVVVAPADGRIVVVEEVEENEYFHDRRMMVSIFMSLFNVHANWIPVDGTVKIVRHQSGNFHRAWLPKASAETAMTSWCVRWLVPWPDALSPMPRRVRNAMWMSIWASSSSVRG